MRIPRPRRRLPVLLVALILLGFPLVLVVGDEPLLEVVEPPAGAVVGMGGVEVMVRFPEGERVAADTFRVLLNGADMTSHFTIGENGSHGRLYDVLDGENRLRFEIFGRRWWLPGLLVEEARDVRFLVRRPQHLDRG